MSLREELEAHWARTREFFPEMRDAYEAMVRQLESHGVAAGSVKPGGAMPEFELPNAEGRLIASTELLGRGALVLSFFRGGWCPYCTLELKALQRALPEIESAGGTLAAVTPETGTAFVAAKQVNALGYEVLSDADHGLALNFGIVFRVPEAIHRLYLRLGIDLGERHGNRAEVWLLPVPATYVIDRAGVIRHAKVDADFKRRMEPNDIVAALRSIAAG